MRCFTHRKSLFFPLIKIILTQFIIIGDPFQNNFRLWIESGPGGKHMRTFTQNLAILALACLLLTSCAENSLGIEGKTVVITPAIKGNSAVLNVGDTLEIRIPTIPTSGFEWVAQDLNTDILVQQGSAVYNEDSSPNSAGGTVTLVFKAVGSGQLNLNLLYVNSPSNEGLALSKNSFGMLVEVK
jgi:predicted secreted protein